MNEYGIELKIVFFCFCKNIFRIVDSFYLNIYSLFLYGLVKNSNIYFLMWSVIFDLRLWLIGILNVLILNWKLYYWIII